MILFRTCGRCGGDVQRFADLGTLIDRCFQCGYRREYEVRTRPRCPQGRKPKALAEQGRMPIVA